MNKQLKKVLGFAATGAIVALLLWIGGAEALTAIREASPIPLLLSVFISLLLFPVASVRWGLITDELAGRKVATQWDYFRIRVLSGASGYLAPREVAELGGRTFWLNKARGISLSQAAQGVLLDRICDLLVSFFVLAGCMFYWLGLASAWGGLAAMGAASLVLVAVTPWMLRNARRGGAVSFAGLRRLASYFPFVQKRLDRMPELASMSPSAWRWAIAIGIVKFVLTVARILAAAASVGLNVDQIVMTLATPISQLGYLFAFTPGAIGVYEAGWLAILSAIGASVSISAAFVLVQRASHIMAVILLSPLCLLIGASGPSDTALRST